MIKLFRNIRRKLLSENRVSRYIIYAIGEIVLVVIGILIALSINNWNEDRKLKKEFTSHLKTIDENLEKDANTIAINIKNGSKYEEAFKENLSYDSLVIDGRSILMSIGQPGLFLDDNGYRIAKDKNTLELIKGDSLKNLFHEYYIKQMGVLERDKSLLEKIGSDLKMYYLDQGGQSKGLSKQEIMSNLMKQGPFLDYLEMYNNQRESTLLRLAKMSAFISRLRNAIAVELKQHE